MNALLEVSGVSVSFDGFRAINNLTFNINAAELRAIIGPNGAGKSTFMDIVTGKTRPDKGSVTFGEKSLSLLKMTEAQIARAGIGRKFQRPTVFEDQTVARGACWSGAARRRMPTGLTPLRPRLACPTIWRARRGSLATAKSNGWK
jgi:urea transport system ATP-binding protein